jgi:hypothetical protein
MDKIALEVRKELLRVLSKAYRQTERFVPATTMAWISGHDEAILYVARQLGFTEQEVYHAADIDRRA